MKSGDVVYYVDKDCKFYFDMKFIEIVHIKEFNVDLYKCEILYNKYKFNDESFTPQLELKGKVDIFSKYNIALSLQEAEAIIEK